ncbi:MAG: DMT family transporter [bacterium]
MAIVKKKVSHRFAVAMLVFTCALWGTSFSSVKLCGAMIVGSSLPGTSAAFGPVLLTALRFTLAVPLLFLFCSSNRTWRPKRSDLPPLLRVALPMTVGFLTQAAGLAFTTATISGFITGLCVCVTPAFEWLLLSKRPTWRLVAGALLAIVGVALMTLTQGGSGSFGWGEVLTLICTFAFTLQIIYTGRSSEKLGAPRLTLGSFVMVALCGWIAALVMSPDSVTAAIRGVAVSPRFWLFFVVILLGATIGASVLMNTFQRYIRPSEAAIVYVTEPLFASAFAVLFIGQGELPSGWGWVGAGLMIVANLLVAMKSEERLPQNPAGA